MTLKDLLLSKRFISFFVSLIVWIVLLLATDQDPISLATGLTMLTAIYIGAETIRKSDKKI